MHGPADPCDTDATSATMPQTIDFHAVMTGSFRDSEGHRCAISALRIDSDQTVGGS
jgi:hypothetical protein